MVASEIRALFAVAARPEVVSLAGGMPYISALPLDVVGEMAGQLVADRGAVALQYGSGQGDPGLREGICEVMSLEGIRAHPDEVVVTVGSQRRSTWSPGSSWIPATWCGRGGLRGGVGDVYVL